MRNSRIRLLLAVLVALAAAAAATRLRGTASSAAALEACLRAGGEGDEDCADVVERATAAVDKRPVHGKVLDRLSAIHHAMGKIDHAEKALMHKLSTFSDEKERVAIRKTVRRVLDKQAHLDNERIAKTAEHTLREAITGQKAPEVKEEKLTEREVWTDFDPRHAKTIVQQKLMRARLNLEKARDTGEKPLIRKAEQHLKVVEKEAAAILDAAAKKEVAENAAQELEEAKRVDRGVPAATEKWRVAEAEARDAIDGLRPPTPDPTPPKPPPTPDMQVVQAAAQAAQRVVTKIIHKALPTPASRLKEKKTEILKDKLIKAEKAKIKELTKKEAELEVREQQQEEQLEEKENEVVLAKAELKKAESKEGKLKTELAKQSELCAMASDRAREKDLALKSLVDDLS